MRKSLTWKALVAAFMVPAAIAAKSSPAIAGGAQAHPDIGEWGLDIKSMSTTVKPGDDFYRYVNEGWLKTATIPVGMSAVTSFTDVFLSTEQRIAAIIRKAQQEQGAPGTPHQQIADFYRSHFDIGHRNALGIQPIANIPSLISNAKDRDALAHVVGYPWMSAMIDGGVLTNARDPRRQIAAVGVGGLSMPSREYYLTEGQPYAGYRDALLAYISGCFRRAGLSDAESRAARVLTLETEIARRHWSTEQKRDVVRMDHVMTSAELKALAPGFPWDAMLSEMGLDKVPQFKVVTDTAVRDIAALYAETSLSDLQSYLLFRTLDAWADSLSDAWIQAHFDFHAKALQGVERRRSAELESTAAVNAVFGEEIGRIYVAEYFSAADRAMVEEMVSYLRATFRDRITKLDWMDEPTRAEALAKLDKIASHIGYPDRWHDRSTVRISADDLVGNQMRLIEWRKSDMLAKLAEGTRDWELPYSPQEINAGYIAELNSITFPAGILQAPFFDRNADAAVNFGAIVAVIGHEIGHAFDDQGSLSDGDGKLRDWWTSASRAAFEQRTAGLAEQFDQYEPLPGTRINGRQNLGENIGDLGGLAVAYAAYRRFVDEKQGGKAPVLGGFTGDQRFFMSWAQVWRSLATDSEMRRRLLSDPHSPGEFRTNGIVRNVDGWYEAFGVKPGDKLYLPPAKRISIW